MKEAWVQEIRRRGVGRDHEDGAVIESFASSLLDLMPHVLGPYRGLVEPLWVRAAELFGAIAAKRGLAAGEAIEELHLLRELLFKELFDDPPMGGSVARVSLREVLALNRAMDRAVTYASVGHTDALFFEFFEGESGPSLLDGEDVEAQARAQLTEIRDEVSLILRHAEATSAAGLGN